MNKVSYTGKKHFNFCSIRSIYNFLISNWSTRLNYSFYTSFYKYIYAISKREKSIEAAIEFLIFEGWNCLAFCTAILQLSNRLGCPAPIPIVEKLLHKTIAFDFTCLEILKANWISANSLLLGFNLVTHFNFFYL